MNIYLCDDEIKILEEISARVKEYLPEAEVVAFSSGRVLLEKIKQASCDILLLDIDMPELSGMEVAKQLSELSCKPLLIFVTGHDELVYESFRYHPFGFIRKQFWERELEKVLADCQKELEQAKRHFNFHTTGGEVCLLLSELRYFESEGNYLKLVAFRQEAEKEEQQMVYRFRSTIGAVETALVGDGFLRLHKGFLVNQTAIRLFGTETVELVDGTILPVGKTYAERAKQQFMRYLRS